ncbi:MAG: hypothetical protein ACYC4L_19535 [Chloroflexota bacterium]
MKRRWLVYLAVGALFGAFDFVYLTFLYQDSWRQAFAAAGEIARWLVFLFLNVGIWLLPVVPIALYEARRTGSRLLAALASVTVWCAAIVAYYLTNAAQLAFWGLPTRMEMHVSNSGAPEFWANWASVLRGDILGGMVEWLVVAVVGGAVVGFLAGSLFLRFGRPRDEHALVSGR